MNRAKKAELKKLKNSLEQAEEILSGYHKREDGTEMLENELAGVVQRLTEAFVCLAKESV